MNDEDVGDEYLMGRSCQMPALAGALVDLPETGRIEAEVGPDRGREALLRARDRTFWGNHGPILDRAPPDGSQRRHRAVGGVHHVQDDDEHKVCGHRAAGGAQSAFVVHLVHVVAYKDTATFNSGRILPGSGSGAVIFEHRTWPAMFSCCSFWSLEPLCGAAAVLHVSAGVKLGINGRVCRPTCVGCEGINFQIGH